MSLRLEDDLAAQSMQALEAELVIPASLEAALLDEVVNDLTARAMDELEAELVMPAELEAALLDQVVDDSGGRLTGEHTSAPASAKASDKGSLFKSSPRTTTPKLIAGKYRLERPIGKGAMGVVWDATHEGTFRQVAIKLILEPTEDLRVRLVREARAYGVLRHRNIVEILDMGQTDEGDPFLVMQFLVGETLADRLSRKRRLGVPEAARIARDVARALTAAHAAGIVHRDLKPANIFLHEEPGEDLTVVKVIDFGVSKNLLAADGLSTVAGGMVGSPAYMSPEQAAAGTHGPIDHRADLWSLGVVLFEMLTGVRPLQGDANTVVAQIGAGEIPLVTSFVRTVDPNLANLVARCLDRDLARRVGSAADLAVQLQAFTSASMGSGSSPLGQSASGMMSPFSQGQQSDADVLVSPRGGLPSVPGRDASGFALAPPRGSLPSFSERDPVVRSPRMQGGMVVAGPWMMPSAGDDDSDDQATAKLSPDMLRAFAPAAKAMPPPQMSPHTSGTVPMTAKLEPGGPSTDGAMVTNQGTVKIPPEALESFISPAAGLEPPPAPPPRGPGFEPSGTTTTAPLTRRNAGDPSSADMAPPQKSRRTPLLVAGAVVGVVLAALVAVVVSQKIGKSRAPITAESVATESTSAPVVASVPTPSAVPGAPEPQVAPPIHASAEPITPIPSASVTTPPAVSVASPGAKSSPIASARTLTVKPPQSGAPAKSGKLPGFLRTPSKRMNSLGF
jgi:eukaryotic-like serine/threonine-protein kinase